MLGGHYADFVYHALFDHMLNIGCLDIGYLDIGYLGKAFYTFLFYRNVFFQLYEKLFKILCDQSITQNLLFSLIFLLEHLHILQLGLHLLLIIPHLCNLSLEN